MEDSDRCVQTCATRHLESMCLFGRNSTGSLLSDNLWQIYLFCSTCAGDAELGRRHVRCLACPADISLKNLSSCIARANYTEISRSRALSRHDQDHVPMYVSSHKRSDICTRCFQTKISKRAPPSPPVLTLNIYVAACPIIMQERCF